MENNWEFHHIEIVVRDMDKTVKRYQSLGIVEFTPEFTLDNNSFTNLMIWGKPVDFNIKLRGRLAQIGPVHLELLQPVDGKTPHREFLDSRGESIMSIFFAVDDLVKETDKLVKKGIRVIFSGIHQETLSVAIFDTREVGNVFTGLQQQHRPA